MVPTGLLSLLRRRKKTAAESSEKKNAHPKKGYCWSLVATRRRTGKFPNDINVQVDMLKYDANLIQSNMKSRHDKIKLKLHKTEKIEYNQTKC